MLLLLELVDKIIWWLFFQGLGVQKREMSKLHHFSSRSLHFSRY